MSRTLDITYSDNSDKKTKPTDARQVIEMSKEVNRNCDGLEGMTCLEEFLPLVAKSEF